MIQVREANPIIRTLLIASGMMLVLTACMLLFSEKASAHGYVDSPASRGALCKSQVNTNCGQAQYNPHDLEAPKGFPNAGPADGKIASAGGKYAALDEQSATRWSKVNISSGSKTFKWTISAPHRTSTWKYYITKPNWNPNAPLTRNSFDLTPFCSLDYGGQQPPLSFSHSCNIPERSGYHVILAVWDVYDTTNAFYNVIDVNFGGQGPDPVDTQAPTAPGNLSVSSTTSSSVSLAWGAATDNIGVTNYRIFNGPTLVGTVPASSLNYTVTGLSPNTSYTFTVKAVDAAGNLSNAGNAVTATTPSGGGGQIGTAWAPNKVYSVGTEVTYNGVTYVCRQPHTSIVGWEPPNAAALWQVK